MNRHTLLGLCATLNVAQAWLDQAGPQYREASRHINHAVVEIHRAAGWSAEELRGWERFKGNSWISS